MPIGTTSPFSSFYDPAQNQQMRRASELMSLRLSFAANLKRNFSDAAAMQKRLLYCKVQIHRRAVNHEVVAVASTEDRLCSRQAIRKTFKRERVVMSIGTSSDTHWSAINGPPQLLWQGCQPEHLINGLCMQEQHSDPLLQQGLVHELQQLLCRLSFLTRTRF